MYRELSIVEEYVLSTSGERAQWIERRQSIHSVEHTKDTESYHADTTVYSVNASNNVLLSRPAIVLLLCRQGRGLRRRRGYLPLIRHRGWWRCLGEVITCSGSRPYALVHRHEYSPCTCKIAFSSPQTKGLKPRATLQGTSQRESKGYLTRKSSKPSSF